MRRWLRRGAIALGVLGLVGAAAIAATRTGRALVRWAPGPLALTMPVRGVRPSEVTSSWNEPRSGHRRHHGVDIFARRGTPVVAAAAGEVVRVGDDRLGGHVVWVAGEGSTLYYYAHLDRWRAGLSVGDTVNAGDCLGYVGNTGNAATTPPHLHFGLYPGWRGFRPVDPAPVLRAIQTGKRGTGNR